MERATGQVYLDREGCISNCCKNTFYILLGVPGPDTELGRIWRVAAMQWPEGLDYLRPYADTDRLCETDLDKLEFVGELKDWDAIQESLKCETVD